jgi:arsenate reductase
MTEGLLRHEAGDQFEVFSAGTHPAPVRVEAVAAMRDIGIDISAQRFKPVSEFEGQQFDFVITVCDRAREECPVLLGEMQRLHWPFQNPATFTETGEQRLDAFRRLRDRIHARVMVFLGESTCCRCSQGIVRKRENSHLCWLRSDCSRKTSVRPRCTALTPSLSRRTTSPSGSAKGSPGTEIRTGVSATNRGDQTRETHPRLTGSLRSVADG